MKDGIIIVGLFLLSMFSCAQEDTKKNDQLTGPDPKNYKTELVLKGVDIPWGMCWLPDGSMLVTEINGTITMLKNGKSTLIGNVPKVYRNGQGGLMDIEAHPNYSQNGWIYITYSSDEGEEKGGNTALIRAKLKDNQLVQIEKLYKAVPNTTKVQHFGSRIRFDEKGYLYFSIGDRGNHDLNPQSLTHDGGKIYRLKDDGSIPSDNPFVNVPNAKKATYSYGHRNPQGMVFNKKTGEIWVNEHGPQGGDEINVIKKGANYGWPVITYGINYNGTPITDITKKEGMEQPLHYWVPSIAPSGMEIVTSNLYPGWQGQVLVGSLKFQYLELLKLNSSNKVTGRLKLLDKIGRVRNVRQGPDGYIYVAVEHVGILKIIPGK